MFNESAYATPGNDIENGLTATSDILVGTWAGHRFISSEVCIDGLMELTIPGAVDGNGKFQGVAEDSRSIEMSVVLRGIARGENKESL